MGGIFFTVLYQPLYNALVVLYNLIPGGGLGLAIILVTIIVKGALMPLTYKSMRAQKELQEIQPKVKEIREKYKDNQEELAKQLMGVYKQHNVNPFASCLPMIAQLIVFIALYQVLGAGIETVDPEKLYSFVANPGTMTHMFLGIDLAHISIPLTIIAAIASFFQARQMVSRRPPKAARQSAEGDKAMDEDMAATMNKTTMFMLPVMTLIIGLTTVPAGLILYMLVSTIVTFIMYQFFLGKPVQTPEKSE